MGILIEKAVEVIETIKNKDYKIDNIEQFCKQYKLTKHEFDFLYNCSKPNNKEENK
jgi:hypothetical protein